MRQAVTSVGLTVHDERTLRLIREEPDDSEADAFVENVEGVLECAGLAETLEPAPDRFAGTIRNLKRACKRFVQGAMLVERGLAEENRELFARAMGEWRIASNLVQAGNRRLKRPERTEALPIPVAEGVTRTSRIEPRLTRIANANRDLYAPVRCWSATDWTRIEREEFGKRANLAGYASREFESINLAPRMCDALALIAYTKDRPGGMRQLEIAFAFVVLMHETSHLADSGQFASTIGQQEPAAECWGIQHVRPAAEALGAGKAYAAALAQRYWLEVYPHAEAKYRSPECRNGGKLDARPTTDVWP